MQLVSVDDEEMMMMTPFLSICFALAGPLEWVGFMYRAVMTWLSLGLNIGVRSFLQLVHSLSALSLSLLQCKHEQQNTSQCFKLVLTFIILILILISQGFFLWMGFGTSLATPFTDSCTLEQWILKTKIIHSFTHSLIHH